MAIVAGLDIGTTKIVCIIGESSANGKFRKLGMARTESKGVERGVVRNILTTAESIRKAVTEASAQAQVEVKRLYVGIAGQHIKGQMCEGSIPISASHNLITEKDVEELIENQKRAIKKPGIEIIHIIPQGYTVDNEPLDTRISPIGVAGRTLKANFHVVTGTSDNINNILYAVHTAGYETKGIILEPIASAKAVLNDIEEQAGVALVDIGGGTTDIAIITNGIVRYTSVLPVAGGIITDDICDGCKILAPQAESLKIKYGSCLPSNTSSDNIYAIPGIRNQPQREISEHLLSKIINSRMKLILELIGTEIKTSGYSDQLLGGLVLTGGGSKLNHLIELSDLTTGKSTRIGIPDEHIEATTANDEIAHPMYATAVGIVLYGLEKEMRRTALNEEQLKDVEKEKEEEKEATEAETKEEKKEEMTMTQKIDKFFNKILSNFHEE